LNPATKTRIGELLLTSSLALLAVPERDGVTGNTIIPAIGAVLEKGVAAYCGAILKAH
jgi:hypothetical protein